MPVFFLSTGLRTNWQVGGAAVFIAAAVLLLASVSGKLIGTSLAGKILKWSAMLRGDDFARTQELVFEYAPRPPFASGTPELAGERLTCPSLEAPPSCSGCGQRGRQPSAESMDNITSTAFPIAAAGERPHLATVPVFLRQHLLGVRPHIFPCHQCIGRTIYSSLRLYGSMASICIE